MGRDRPQSVRPVPQIIRADLAPWLLQSLARHLLQPLAAPCLSQRASRAALLSKPLSKPAQPLWKYSSKEPQLLWQPATWLVLQPLARRLSQPLARRLRQPLVQPLFNHMHTRSSRSSSGSPLSGSFRKLCHIYIAKAITPHLAEDQKCPRVIAFGQGRDSVICVPPSIQYSEHGVPF
jgi:hypothetical protein